MKKVKEFPLQKKRKLIQETYLEEVDMGHEDVSQLKKAIKERVFELTDKISSEDFEKLFADLKEKERAKAQIKSLEIKNAPEYHRKILNPNI